MSLLTRRCASRQPVSQSFSHDANRTFRVKCCGNDFADLSTAVLEFTVVNNSTSRGLKTLSANGSCVYSELRLLLSGIEAEKIEGGCYMPAL